jgi:hypothetical protein
MNYSMDTEYDIDAILKEYRIVPPINSFDDTPVLSVKFDSTLDNPSHEGDCFITSSSVKSDVQEADDICRYDKNNVQFGSDARGALISFAAYNDGPSSMCPKTMDNLILTSKQINFTCHTEEFNLSERYVNDDRQAAITHTRSKQINFTCHTEEFNLSEKYVNDDGQAAITYHSVQETCDHSADPWPWTNLSSPYGKYDDDGIEVPNWKEFMHICNTLSNDTISESPAWTYTDSHIPTDVMSDNIHAYTDKQEQFWNDVFNYTELSTINSNKNSVSKNTQQENRQNNLVEDYDKKEYDVDFPEYLSFIENNQYTVL